MILAKNTRLSAVLRRRGCPGYGRVGGMEWPHESSNGRLNSLPHVVRLRLTQLRSGMWAPHTSDSNIKALCYCGNTNMKQLTTVLATAVVMLSVFCTYMIGCHIPYHEKRLDKIRSELRQQLVADNASRGTNLEPPHLPDQMTQRPPNALSPSACPLQVETVSFWHYEDDAMKFRIRYLGNRKVRTVKALMRVFDAFGAEIDYDTDKVVYFREFFGRESKSVRIWRPFPPGMAEARADIIGVEFSDGEKWTRSE